MSDRQATCAERLPEHLTGRLQDLELLAAAAGVYDADSLRDLLAKRDDGGKLFDALDSLGVDTTEIRATPLEDQLEDADAEQLAESAREALDSYGLSVDVRTTLVWQLSTGGPGDQFELEVSREGYGYSIDAARYRFLDWFDGATAELEPEQRATVERAAELLGILEPGIVLPTSDR
jgi:hypothetical protein